jgi:transcriptional regulator of acetoin/glycerol metabolism
MSPETSPSDEHPILVWIRQNIHTAVQPLAIVERDAILRAMILCRGDVLLASRLLGISRKTLYLKLNRYRREEQLPPPPLRD